MPTSIPQPLPRPSTATSAEPSIECRFCSASVSSVFVDLGSSPLANNYLTREQTWQPERFYPLKAYVCERCFLVQLGVQQSPEHIFSDYAYFSSFTDSWVQHAREYVDQVVERLALNAASTVIEIASNDGYLLQHFVERRIPVLGIEPAANVAAAAVAKGIPTRIAFFGKDLARQLVAEGTRADLIVANNVLAHVPALNDFVAGIAVLLNQRGVATLEFPYLLRLMAESQFDTIYHEHFSYFSFTTVNAVFAAHGLTLFDVAELSTHGGSLRIFARHTDDQTRPVTAAVSALLARETAAGLRSLATYAAFGEQVREIKRQLLQFLIDARRRGEAVVGYGAPAKGNTLLNYCGVRTDFLDFTVDRSPHKQGLFLPGTHLPIFGPEAIAEVKPAYVLILPWNVKEEVMQQMSHIRAWGGQFVVPVPAVKVYP